MALQSFQTKSLFSFDAVDIFSGLLFNGKQRLAFDNPVCKADKIDR